MSQDSTICLIKILENVFSYWGLQVGTEWNIEKAAIKKVRKDQINIKFVLNWFFYKLFIFGEVFGFIKKIDFQFYNKYPTTVKW